MTFWNRFAVDFLVFRKCVYVFMFFIVSVFDASEAKAATRMHTSPMLLGKQGGVCIRFRKQSWCRNGFD